jgi:sugar phosphate isomerase/epimerase
MIRIGVDGRKIPHADSDTALDILTHAHALGMEGVYFRTVIDITPTLDLGLLREVRAHADHLGLYLQLGLAKVNPYAAAEAPEIRVLGDGDYTRGMVKMMRACRDGAGCGELWVACCNYKPDLPGVYAIDRFRTDAPWPDQLAATERFLHLLAPAARDLDCHLNLETHEEITSYEVVRLVESVGPDVMGITFDTANGLVRGEDPIATARRVAPYVRAAHLRDCALGRIDHGIARVFVPCGRGIIDWRELMSVLSAETPDLNASIECAASAMVVPIPFEDEVWQRVHPDLDRAEIAALIQLTEEYERRAERGDVLPFETLPALPYDGDQFILDSAAVLRGALQDSP